jgi:Rrf2 family protein
MHISARADYAMRAALCLAVAAPDVMTAAAIADEQNLPRKFLEAILTDLRHANLVQSQRGIDGGYRLTRPASAVAVAHVLHAVDGPLAAVRGERAETVTYSGSAQHLRPLWIATRAALREVLGTMTLADLVTGTLPDGVQQLLTCEGVWLPRGVA